MTDKKSATADIAVEKELEGVPEHMKDETPEATDTADAKIAALEEAIAAAQQDVLPRQPRGACALMPRPLRVGAALTGKQPPGARTTLRILQSTLGRP